MRRKIIAYILILIILAAGCRAQVASWQDNYDLGVRYLSEGNYQEAIIAFNAAIMIDPQIPEAYLMRGDAFVMAAQNEPDAASIYLQKAESDYETVVTLDTGLEDVVASRMEELEIVREETGAEPPSRSGDPAAETEEQTAVPYPSVSASYVYRESYHEDGTTLCTLDYPESIVLSHPDEQIAAIVNADMQNQCRDILEFTDSFSQSAIEEYHEGGFYPYTYAVWYDTHRIDNAVWSTLRTESIYAGGAHGSNYSFGMTYDMATGQLLTLENILVDSDAAPDALRQLLESKLTELDNGYWFLTPAEIAYSSIIEESASTSRWYFNQTGLVFYYSVYEIASYADGPKAAEIPYEALHGILKEQYFPAEAPAADGTIRHRILDDTQEVTSARSHSIQLSDDGYRVALTADGTILDVCVYSCAYDYQGALMLSELLYSTSAMYSGDTVVIRTRFDEMMPALAITYTGSEGEVTRYITQSETGGSILMDGVPAAQIPEEAFSYNGHSYAFLRVEGTWDDIVAYCESLGGHLATITSQEENDYVFTMLQESEHQSAYFGLTDRDEEGIWVWVNGESTAYTNWHANEPNAENNGEDYAMFYYKFTDGTWNDGDFGGSTVNGGTTFICEWN